MVCGVKSISLPFPPFLYGPGGGVVPPPGCLGDGGLGVERT